MEPFSYNFGSKCVSHGCQASIVSMTRASGKFRLKFYKPGKIYSRKSAGI